MRSGGVGGRGEAGAGEQQQGDRRLHAGGLSVASYLLIPWRDDRSVAMNEAPESREREPAKP
jgi:hypothetical protein